jgi:hypothetical protein
MRPMRSMRSMRCNCSLLDCYVYVFWVQVQVHWFIVQVHRLLNRKTIPWCFDILRLWDLVLSYGVTLLTHLYCTIILTYENRQKIYLFITVLFDNWFIYWRWYFWQMIYLLMTVLFGQMTYFTHDSTLTTNLFTYERTFD